MSLTLILCKLLNYNIICKIPTKRTVFLLLLIPLLWMRRRCLGGALSNVLDFPQNASHICDVFVCVPYIRSSWCSTVKPMFAQDVSGSIFDVPLACWIQLCFVRLLKNKMTVTKSETIVLCFNLIAHWQSYTQKRIMNFEKKYVSVAPT